MIEKLEAEGREFEKILRSLEQFIQTFANSERSEQFLVTEVFSEQCLHSYLYLKVGT